MSDDTEIPEWFDKLEGVADEIAHDGYCFMWVSAKLGDHSDNHMLMGADNEHTVVHLCHLNLALAGNAITGHRGNASREDMVTMLARVVYESAPPGTPATHNPLLQAVVQHVEELSRADREPDLIPVRQLH